MDDLEPFPTDWTRALAVVAHPDDLEYGAASAIARWTDEGREVVYLLVTSGEAGIDGLVPERCGPVREDEERRSAAVVGVSTVEFLRYPDGVLVESLDLRRDLAAAIRRHRPEVLVTINHQDTWGPGAPNHADHRVVGRSLLDATRDAANRWVFPELSAAGLDPWTGARWMGVNATPEPTHALDVTGWLDRGIASLREHQAYLDGLGGDPDADPTAFLGDFARQAGSRIGVEHAVLFQVYGL